MESIGVLLAAAIPSVIFITVILYFTVFNKDGGPPKVVKTEHSLKVVGISTITTDASFREDDALLWTEFKRLREKNSMPKPLTYVLIKMMPKEGETSWEYFVGVIEKNFDNVAPGFKTLEVAHQTYTVIKHTFKKEVAWLEKTIKIENNFYNKWLPSSEYEINTNSIIKSIEYHNLKVEANARTITFYAAVRKKKSLRSDFGG